MQLKEAFEKAVKEAKETNDLIDLVAQIVYGRKEENEKNSIKD